MKNLGKIDSLKSIVTKEYVDGELDKVRIIIEGEQASLPKESGAITLPLATQERAGLVRVCSSNEINGVSLNENHQLTINKIDIKKLVQLDEDELIFESSTQKKGGN